MKDGRPQFVYFEETINSSSSLFVKIIHLASAAARQFALALLLRIFCENLKSALLINFVFMWASVCGVFCMCSWDMKHGW